LSLFCFTEDEKDATHIIHSPTGPTEVGDFLCPVLRRGDGHLLVHWPGLPDSHDSWITADLDLDIPENFPPPPGHGGKASQVHVTAEWVLETDRYNEWMNEDDFLVDEHGRKKHYKWKMTVEEFTHLAEDRKGKKHGKRRRSPSPAAHGRGNAGGKRKRYSVHLHVPGHRSETRISISLFSQVRELQLSNVLR
jgi:SWI/SNF related-matrix-associated actin-dependent regulator of chromatin subfamily C